MKQCIITIFYLIDNFCQEYKKCERNKLLPSSKHRNRDGQLSLSELLTVVLYFYLSPCRDFKNYYLHFLPSKYKGYISKKLFEELFASGLKIFTTIRKDMKNHLFSNTDKILLQKRSLIESVFNVLKNSMNLQHSRHRSPANFIVHIIACIASFSIAKIIKKPNLVASITSS